MKKKILTIVGARPQFIKASVVSLELLKHTGVVEYMLHTGQHYDSLMSGIFFKELGLAKPFVTLNLEHRHHIGMIAEMIIKIEKSVLEIKPDLFLVYGDTNSTLAGALVACKLKIPLVHVEAGLRSGQMDMPEESNRILTDRMSQYLFCPTILAYENLKKEGFDYFGCHMEVSGDVMYDSYLLFQKHQIKPHFDLPKKYALLTLHREKNVLDKKVLNEIIDAMNKINENLPVIFIAHPHTRAKIKEYEIKCAFEVKAAVGYFEMIYLLENSHMVFTDSGGLQKDAYFAQKKCVILRDETEWNELLDVGTHLLGGIQSQKITKAYEKLDCQSENNQMKIFGDGKAAEKIVKSLLLSIA